MEPIELPGWAGGFDGQGSGDSSAHGLDGDGTVLYHRQPPISHVLVPLLSTPMSQSLPAGASCFALLIGVSFVAT